jgi:rhamnosyltransferase subunit B
MVMENTEALYDVVRTRLRDDSIVLTGSLAFGARFAAESAGVPQAVLHLQPCILMSAHHVPVLQSGRTLEWLPVWARRVLIGAMKRGVMNPVLRRPLNRVRGRLGLKPLTQGIVEWWSTADLVLGLFPDWFAPPQPDWPPGVRLTGFPTYGGRGAVDMQKQLVEFLDGGTPPVVISPGSANAQASRYIAAAIDGVRQLGRRSLVLTPFREQVPDPLPAGCAHIDYVPFEDVLPRAAALIHHGGIGTVSQAFAAGIPQLIHPLAFDQPDNAVRVARTGAGGFIPARRFTARAVRDELGRLLEDPAVTAKAAALAARMRTGDPVGEAAEHLLGLVSAASAGRPVLG